MMIQVLNKAFRLLEYVSKEPERAHPLIELAGITGTTSAACSHLVKTLVGNGYLEQSERRQGYKLGPMAYYLSRNGVYRQDLVTRIEPYLRELTGKTGETSGLSRLHNRKKHVLLTCRTTNPVQIDDTLLYLDLFYETASGRVLLAYQERREQSAILTEHGLPGNRWDGIDSEEKFYRVLDDLRREEVCIMEPRRDIVFMAVPVFSKERIFGALTLSLPAYRLTPEQRYFFSGELLKCAGSIGQVITPGD